MEITPETLTATYGNIVSSLARRMIRNHETARDAAQEVWYEVLKSLPSFQGKSLFSTWLYTIARRTILNYAQKEKNWSVRFLSEVFEIRRDDGIPEMVKIPVEDRSTWVKLQCSDCVTAILHCLENESRLIYLFRVLTDLNFSDLSSIFQKEEAAVRKTWSRARRKIHNFLNGHCFLYNLNGNCRCKLKKPIMALDQKREYQKVFGQSRKIFFLNKAENYYESPNFWKTFLKELKD